MLEIVTVWLPIPIPHPYPHHQGEIVTVWLPIPIPTPTPTTKVMELNPNFIQHLDVESLLTLFVENFFSSMRGGNTDTPLDDARLLLAFSPMY